MYTQRQTEAVAPKNTMDGLNNADEVLSTSEATDSYRGTSTFNWPSTTPDVDATRHFPIPQIQGIIPGIRSALRINAASPSLSHSPRSSHDVVLGEKLSESATIIPTTLITSTPPSPRHSTFPRVSPPGFLYPEAIVPHTAMSAQNSNSLQYSDSVPHKESAYHSSIMGRVDYELAYLPTGYKLLFVGTLAVLVLGFVWALMVWAVNIRMNTVNGMKEGKGKRKKGVGNRGEERRPIDKVSKYAHRHGSESEVQLDKRTGMNMESGSAVTSAAQVPFSYLENNEHVGEGIEMKYRPQHKTSQHKTSQHNRPRSRPLHSTSTAPSPLNPFLDPPPNGLLQPGTGATLVKRTSLEWQTQRAAFFSPQKTTSTPASRSVSPTLDHANDNSSESFELNVSDMKALEAGTAPLTGRKHPHSHPYSSSSSPGNGGSGINDGFGLVRKSKSWIDQGVGLVDGAVDAFAAKLGRWTDDNGGDEALLLPVARQGRGRGVSVG